MPQSTTTDTKKDKPKDVKLFENGKISLYSTTLLIEKEGEETKTFDMFYLKKITKKWSDTIKAYYDKENKIYLKAEELQQLKESLLEQEI